MMGRTGLPWVTGKCERRHREEAWLTRGEECRHATLVSGGPALKVVGLVEELAKTNQPNMDYTIESMIRLALHVGT